MITNHNTKLRPSRLTTALKRNLSATAHGLFIQSLLAGILLLANSLPAQELLEAYYSKQRAKLVSANAPLVADIVGGPTPELILTDVAGSLKVYDATAVSGYEIASKSFGKESLTPPVVGDFTGGSFLDLAVGTGTGRLIVIDGTSLEVIAERNAGRNFSIQPTTILLTDETSSRDAIFLVDQDGTVRGFRMNDKKGIEELWTYSTGSLVQAPMVVGNIRGKSQDLVAAGRDGVLTLLDAKTGAGLKHIVVQNTPIDVSPLLLDTNSDGRDDVIVALRTGELICFRYEENARPPFQEIWRHSSSSQPVAPPMLLQQGNNINEQYILHLTNTAFQVLEARTGKLVASETAILQGINTYAALIPRPDRIPEVAFGLKQTVQMTNNLGEWVAQRGAVPLRLSNANLPHTLHHGLTVVSGEDKDGLLIVGVSQQDEGSLYAFKTGFPSTNQIWTTRTPWMTMGGTSEHNSILDRNYARRERDRRDAVAAQAAQWKQDLEKAITEGEWDTASSLVSELVNHDPRNPEFAALGRKVFFRKNLVVILASVLGFVFLFTYGSIKATQYITNRNLRRRGDWSFGRGDYDDARRYFQRLYTRQPKNASVALALAKVFVGQRDFSEETLVIYEKAHEAYPNEQDILHAYARALLLEPKTTDKAFAVYEKALPSFPEPALLEYGAGRCLIERNNYEEAGKRLRSALRGGITTDALYRALCETYIRTKNYTSKALPVFQQQFSSRIGDREFLEAYLLACIDGKKADSQVESLCQSVLELSPNFIPAYLHLASILMQKNQVGSAIEEVRSALKIDPANTDAAAMLAQCFLVQNRRDEDAMQAFRMALRSNPEDKELLKIMAAIFHDRGSYDQEAVEIYHRSAEANPADPTTLKALAQAAQLTQNYQLAVRSIEALLNAGQMSQRLTTQLAEAYVKLGIVDPKAERVFREALRVEPNNAEYTGALCQVLVVQDRTDAEVIPVYETHLQNYKHDVNVGRQLAKAYIKADRYENALSVTRAFLQIAPGDDELQRLNALASLYDNKIDEAVSEYSHILQRNPNDPEALVNLALAYGQKNRVDDEAVTFFDRALKIQPANHMLHLAKARVLLSRNDAVNAVESYKSAIKGRANNEQAIVNHMALVLTEYPEALRVRWFMVELLVSQGFLREALEQMEFINKNHPGQTANLLRVLESILAKDPNNLGALLQRGNLLLGNNQLDEAQKMLERAHQLRPSDATVIEKLTLAYQAALEKKDSADVRIKLGKLYFSQQEYDHAIGCFQKTAQDYRWEGESTKMLGKCFTGKGMLDIALQEFKKLVVDDETKELLYDLAQRYEAKKDLVGAKTVYRQLFAADIGYKDVKTRFEMLSGSTSDPMAFEKTSIVQQMSEEAARRYELLDELGRGAMGIVYRARDKELEEVVALKILPDNMSNNPEAVRRFKIEARNARKLSHPNIVRIHDIGEEMGRKYISMEYVDGSDLKKKMRSMPDFKLPLATVIKYSIQIADALGYAHRVGVVHRDIKPANIMLTGADDVKITDFGIAKMMDQAGGEGTMIGAVIGTPLYMSPEQVQGVPVDNRADLYAYGIMFYELLNGRPPFTEGDLAYQHIHREPTPIPDVSEPLWQIVAKCLQKKKEDRWDNAEAIYDALRELKKSQGL